MAPKIDFIANWRYYFAVYHWTPLGVHMGGYMSFRPIRPNSDWAAKAPSSVGGRKVYPTGVNPNDPAAQPKFKDPSKPEPKKEGWVHVVGLASCQAHYPTPWQNRPNPLYSAYFRPQAVFKYLHMAFATSLTTYLREAVVEMKKVIWPSRQQTLTYTVIVLIMSIGLAFFFTVLDNLFNRIVEFLIAA